MLKELKHKLTYLEYLSKDLNTLTVLHLLIDNLGKIDMKELEEFINLKTNL